MIRIIVAFALIASASHAGAAEYCIRNLKNKDRIEKNGVCPTGYFSSGECCEAFHEDTKRAAHKVDGRPCPSGSYASQNYCIIF